MFIERLSHIRYELHATTARRDEACFGAAEADLERGTIYSLTWQPTFLSQEKAPFCSFAVDAII